MTPRMKSSKKSTAFPKEYTEQIETVFKENFATHMKGARLVVEGRIYPHEVLLRVGFRRADELRQANFETSMEYSADEKDALDRIHNCVDAAASMMLEYIENEGNVDFPLLWQEFPLQERKIFLKYSTENSDLEAEANKLLGIDSKGFVDEVAETEEDALERAESLTDGAELESDADAPAEAEISDEEKGPRMFGGPFKPGKKKKEDLH